jgi:putative ubiquitin-RnfH superfamily antitoxin RatB of RatAB toxin-antitoxin module
MVDSMRTEAGTAQRLRVLVCASFAPRTVDEEWLELPLGATVADALRVSALAARWRAELPDERPTLGIWSAKATPKSALTDQDRIELCRPLRVDPKVARRERFQKQGAKAAGLFARKRAGAKAGY